MKALLIVLLVLAAIASLPVGARVRYDADGVLLRLVAGPVRIGLLPKKKKTPKQQETEARKKEQKKEKKQAAQEKKAAQDEKKPTAEGKAPEKKGGSVLDFLPLLEPAFDFLGAFRRRLLLRRLVLKVTFAGGDPCELALNYGRAWAAVGNLMPCLERWFRIRKRDVSVQCAFTGGSMAVEAELYITITVGWVLYLGVHHGLRLLRAFLRVKKKRGQREEEKAVQKS